MMYEPKTMPPGFTLTWTYRSIEVEYTSLDSDGRQVVLLEYDTIEEALEKSWELFREEVYNYTLDLD